MLIRMLCGKVGIRKMLRWLLFVLGTAVSLPAHAQLTAPVKNSDATITVTGTRTRESKVEMSNWRMAETPHVVVFSQNDEKELRDTAHNLEKLHFLLSALFGRVDAPDETIKIAVTMIGDAGPFEQLRLTDLRWQYGPFPERFAKTIYYDPREEGSVLATTKNGVNLVLRPSYGRPTNRNCYDDDRSPPLSETPDPSKYPVNELAFCQSAASRLYAGFAQNYLMTYFPAAYPRWFLQGFAEIFATMKAGDDFVEYGHRPPGFIQVMEHYQYNGLSSHRHPGRSLSFWAAGLDAISRLAAGPPSVFLGRVEAAVAQLPERHCARCRLEERRERLRRSGPTPEGRDLLPGTKVAGVRADGLSGRARAGTDRPPNDPGGGRPDPGPARAWGRIEVPADDGPRALGGTRGARRGSTGFARMRGNSPT